MALSCVRGLGSRDDACLERERVATHSRYGETEINASKPSPLWDRHMYVVTQHPQPDIAAQEKGHTLGLVTKITGSEVTVTSQNRIHSPLAHAHGLVVASG